MRDPEDLAAFIAETLLPGALDLTAWGIVQGVELEEDQSKASVVGVAYGSNGPGSPPDGGALEVSNPIRDYRFVLPVQVLSLQHSNETQVYLGRAMTEIQEALEGEWYAIQKSFDDCNVLGVSSSAQKFDNNTGQVDFTITAQDE